MFDSLTHNKSTNKKKRRRTNKESDLDTDKTHNVS